MGSPSAILRRYGLKAKRSWGQCFLHDISVMDLIVRESNIHESDVVVEIGAGLGILTALLAEKARRVVAVEKDRDLVHVLEKELADTPNITITAENILNYDLSSTGSSIVVVGNLPYNIASPILFHILDHASHIRSATIMLQRELADRIVASPGTKTYGVPSVLCQQVAYIQRCAVVKSTSFTPRPRVDSAIISMVMQSDPMPSSRLFRRIVRAAFGARRKQLRNALARSFTSEIVMKALELSGIDGGRRGETLTLQEYNDLASAFRTVTDISVCKSGADDA